MSKIKSQINNSNIKSSNTNRRVYVFALQIISFINQLPNNRAFWSIGDQLLRSKTSIGANMMEAKSSSSKREFIKYYEIALKSANESKYWLCLLRDSYAQLKCDCEKYLSELHEIGNMLCSSILTLKGKRTY